HRYSQAITAANSTGNFDEAYALLPQPDDAEFFQGGFVRDGAFEASYNVSAGWGGHRCISLRVSRNQPAAPNTMALRMRTASAEPSNATLSHYRPSKRPRRRRTLLRCRVTAD
ncbi:MAG: hypothetical protein ABW033_03410, partial [Acidimicrobiia bacterium]